MLVMDAELSAEIMPYRRWLSGKILNAGCGKRWVDLGDDCIRMDINAEFAVDCHIVADVHQLPFRSDTFDSILSVAVLEHTRYAWEVAKEFHRVLKPGGFAVVCIPFIQPRHGAPNDYVRFTDRGIQALMEWAQFNVLHVEPVHSIGFSIEWILREILSEHPLARLSLWPLRRTLFPLLRSGKLLKGSVPNIRSAYYVVAEK